MFSFFLGYSQLFFQRSLHASNRSLRFSSCLGHAPLEAHSAWQIRLIDKPYTESRFSLTHTLLDRGSLNDHGALSPPALNPLQRFSSAHQHFLCLYARAAQCLCVCPSVVQLLPSCPPKLCCFAVHLTQRVYGMGD